MAIIYQVKYLTASTIDNLLQSAYAIHLQAAAANQVSRDLSGPIPESVASLTNLRALTLRRNQLSGE
jgi:hypothetical protein